LVHKTTDALQLSHFLEPSTTPTPLEIYPSAFDRLFRG
jgi:hypothetical protein